MLSRVTTTSQIGETQLIPARVLISRSVIFTAESMRRRLELIVATKTTLVAGWFTLPGGSGGGEGGGGEGGGEGGGGLGGGGDGEGNGGGGGGSEAAARGDEPVRPRSRAPRHPRRVRRRPASAVSA